jgi:glycosidase
MIKPLSQYLPLLFALPLVLLSACNAAEKSTAASISSVTSTEQAAKQVSKQGKAAALAPYLSRDIQDEVFYFVLPDRFNNGDPANDLGSKSKAISAGGFDPSDKGAYHGGDIRGLQQKLPYLDDMGISAIWLTPILRNQAVQNGVSGYHGYWVLDFTEIDPHLGSNADLKAFIDAAHQRNIKVFFDIITNHTADVIKYTECHGADGAGWSEGGEPCPYKSLAQIAQGDVYQTVIAKGTEQLKSPAWLNDAKYYHNQGDTTFVGENSVYGDFFGLDDINTDDPAVVKGMIDIFNKLITEFTPDGFRIDTVKHVNIEFWQQFAPALVKHAKSEGIDKFFMFGEVYSGDTQVLSKYTTTGKLQSVLDFAFQGAVTKTLIEQQGTQVLAQLFEQDSRYNDQDSHAAQLLNFTGNHDMGRFGHMLQKSDLNYSEPEMIKRSLLAHALMYFARGIPVIYYGDEQGFVGKGGDKEARQDMMPSKVADYNGDNLLATNKTTADDNFDAQHKFYQAFAQYAGLYQQYPALRYGKHVSRYSQSEAGVYAFSRTLTDNDNAAQSSEILVLFNTANTEQKVTLELKATEYQRIYPASSENKGHGISNIKSDQQVVITVAPLSFALYQIK